MIRPFKTLCGCLSDSERQIIVLIHQIETDIFKYGICASMPPAKISCFNWLSLSRLWASGGSYYVGLVCGPLACLAWCSLVLFMVSTDTRYIYQHACWRLALPGIFWVAVIATLWCMVKFWILLFCSEENSKIMLKDNNGLKIISALNCCEIILYNMKIYLCQGAFWMV